MSGTEGSAAPHSAIVVCPRVSRQSLLRLANRDCFWNRFLESIRHLEFAYVENKQVVEGAAIVYVQQVQQLAPARIGEGFEQQVGVIEALGHVG